MNVAAVRERSGVKIPTLYEISPLPVSHHLELDVPLWHPSKC